MTDDIQPVPPAPAPAVKRKRKKRVKKQSPVQKFVENHLTPLLIGATVYGYSYAGAHWPKFTTLTGLAHLDQTTAISMVVALMAVAGNYLSRKWSKWF